MGRKRDIRHEELSLISEMIRVFCSSRHGRAGSPCPDCAALVEYAALRLGRCPWGEEKPTCAACRVHCYSAAMRERVREVMRFSGPRMLFYRPLPALRHLLRGLRRKETATQKLS